MDCQIRKYRLKKFESTDLRLPEGTMCMHVGKQDNEVTLWALVPMEAPEVVYRFHAAVTGDRMGENSITKNYLGTVLFAKGSYVVHVFSNCAKLGP